MRKTLKTAAIFPAIASCSCKMPPYSRVGGKAPFVGTFAPVRAQRLNKVLPGVLPGELYIDVTRR